MSWLTKGLEWIKTAKTFVEPISQFLKKEGKYEDLRMGKPDDDTGFMTKHTRDKFGLPSDVGPAGFTLLTKGIGRTRQGLTNIERILEPVHKIQANGYDALANAMIQKAIRDNNLVSERDLLSDTVSTGDSQNIEIGKMSIS